MGSAAMSFRLAASRSLMIVFVITTSLMAYTDAASSSSTECADESQACYSSDAVCSACMLDFDTAQYVECFEESSDNYFSGDAETALPCQLASLYSCCVDAASSNDCMSNDAFVNLNLCIYSVAAASSEVGGECTSLTCSGVDGVDDPEVLGGSGALRADVFSLRALLGLALGVCLFVAVSL